LGAFFGLNYKNAKVVNLITPEYSQKESWRKISHIFCKNVYLVKREPTWHYRVCSLYLIYEGL